MPLLTLASARRCERRSNPDRLGVNATCLEGVLPFDFLEAPVNDGVRHPSDNPEQKPYQAALLRYGPASHD